MQHNDLPDRFHSKVKLNEFTGCIEWTAACRRGYGAFWVNGRHEPAHRVSYEAEWGPIPDGLHLDHLCRNPLCVNPSHLEAVTCKENLARGTRGYLVTAAKNLAKTHCPQGHPYAGVNLLIYKTGSRACRECMKAARVRYNTRKKESDVDNVE